MASEKDTAPRGKSVKDLMSQAVESTTRLTKVDAPKLARVGGPPQRMTEKTSKQADSIIKGGSDLDLNPANGNDMGFVHAIFCQVGLPRSKVDGREFMRKSGSAWMNLQAGYLDEGSGPVAQMLPYGPMPRLALAHVSTHAVRHKTREIPIGDSAAQFLSIMNMDSQGNRYATLRAQMHALAACRLQLGYLGRTFNDQPVQQFDAWQDNRDTGQKALWPGVMVLTEGFFKSLIEGAVPLDMRALNALKGSALALDIYTWLANRLHRLEGKGLILHWASIREQFGQEYTGPEADKNFKAAFVAQLPKVLTVYPRAKVKVVKGGILLSGSPPPIPFKKP